MRLEALRAELVSQLASAELTYHNADATKSTLPTGYHHQHAARVIGSGPETFNAAAAELFSWQAHLRAGLRVTASTATAEPGTVVLLGIGFGPMRMRAPCRVIYTISDPRRKGFAYGHCPGIQNPAKKPSRSATGTTAWSSSRSQRSPAPQPPQPESPGRWGS